MDTQNNKATLLLFSTYPCTDRILCRQSLWMLHVCNCDNPICITMNTFYCRCHKGMWVLLQDTVCNCCSIPNKSSNRSFVRTFVCVCVLVSWMVGSFIHLHSIHDTYPEGKKILETLAREQRHHHPGILLRLTGLAGRQMVRWFVADSEK